jgi:tRNA A37 threonylcarbamoyltransferase TsaD
VGLSDFWSAARIAALDFSFSGTASCWGRLLKRLAGKKEKSKAAILAALQKPIASTLA